MAGLHLALAVQDQGASIDQTLAVDSTALILVRNGSGSIRVEAWERSEVRIRAVLPTGERMNVERKGGGLEIQRIASRNAPPRDFVVMVPRGAAVELGGSRTSFSVTGVRGRIRINGLDGDARVEGGSNGVAVRVVNGKVTVVGASGDLDLRSTAGPVDVSGSAGRLRVETTSGDITIRGDSLSGVEALSLSGHIDFDARLAAGGLYVLQTHHGEVRAVLPKGTDANVDLRTQGGRLRSEWPAATIGRSSRESLTLGNGGARLELESLEGLVRLRQRPSP